MKRLALSFITVVSLLATVALASACGGDDDSHGMGGMHGNNSSGGMTNTNAPAGSIKVDLLNWAVEPAQAQAKAGSVTFWAVHSMDHQHSNSEGGVTHDLQVMKKNADGSFEMVGQVQGLKMGEAKALTLTLTPGDYELSCNVVEEIGGKAIAHYQKGMHTPFKVTA